jgi:small subunit ribosomal protein S4
MIKKHKQFRRPKQIFDTERINSENQVVNKYGLKNKREIWKAKAKLDKLRSQAKKLINSSQENQGVFLERLRKKGFNVKTTSEVLALTEEDILGRRLQTIIVKKNLANTLKEARQLITHKKIKVNENIVNIPSYEVSVEEEGNIKIMEKIKPKKEEKSNEKNLNEEEETNG